MRTLKLLTLAPVLSLVLSSASCAQQSETLQSPATPTVNTAAPADKMGYALEGDYLYRFTTIRAETGSFEALLKWSAALKASDYFDQGGTQAPFIMRHSQGDQWDVMVVTPMGSWTEFHAADASARRSAARAAFKENLTQGYAMMAFSEDTFAYGPDLSSFRKAYNQSGLYHIEMFEAAPGKTAELYKQRQMENEYLLNTGQVANMIFRRDAGSNVDVFTIGFHESFKTFAADAPASPAEKEIAAKAAGFKDRADLSFYLRSLLSGHHDTFATKVE